MENYSNETTKWSSLNESNKSLQSQSTGDFNSAELSQGLGHATNMIANHGTLGMAPSFGKSPESQAPAAPAMPEGGSMPVAPMNIPTPNAAAAAPQQMLSTDLLSTVQGMVIAKMANPTIPTEPSQCGIFKILPLLNLPGPQPSADVPKPNQKVVINEPCTVNQPMNASLRDNHSNGTFYFLPKI
jgi:hypothetical protein